MASSRQRKEKAGHNVKLSKLLSYTLRHGAHEQGIAMDSKGFVLVADLLRHEQFKRFKLEDIYKVVEENDKKRFAIVERDGQTLIRANQGHTFDVPDLELTEITGDDVPQAIHGTFQSAVESIRKNGLSRMARTHIHMATDLPGVGETISGMRQSCDYIVYVNIKKASLEGFKFYRSANGVILCSGNEDGYLPPKYLRIKQRKS